MRTEQQNQTALSASSRTRDEGGIARLLHEYRQSRNPETRDQIVLHFTNLVESVARRFSGATEPVEDLAQEGYIGLITAVDLYDPSKNVKFSTYATHFIIGQIKHYLRDRGKIIKEPAWLQELNQRVTRAIASLTQQLSRPPTHLEIAEMVDMTEEAVAEMIMTREVFKISSIDGGSDTEEDQAGTVDMERQRATDVAVTFQLPLEDRIVLEAAMEKLKELEQRVIVAFYFKHLNQTEIAKQMGISCNYVSHILRNSTKKLKKILVTDELRDAQQSIAQLRKRVDEQQSYIEQNTLVDPLTRLYNRGYFEARLEEELSRGSRQQSEVAVLFVKVDGLEAFIRAYGTLKGDEALQSMVGTIKATVRRSDILTRYDMQTFALILPHTGRNVSVVAERLWRTLEAWLQQHDWHLGRAPLQISMGSAAYPEEEQLPMPLLTVAQNRIAPWEILSLAA